MACQALLRCEAAAHCVFGCPKQRGRGMGVSVLDAWNSCAGLVVELSVAWTPA
jgi:hypothetical protein